MPSYYRSDVPKKSPRRNAIALVVILVVAVVAFFGIRFLWGFAQARSINADATLEKSVLASANNANIEGFAWIDSSPSTDNIDNVLLLTVDDVSKATPTLEEVAILSLNKTSSMARIATLPTPVLVEKEDGMNIALTDLFKESGTASAGGARCADRLAAYEHIRFSHIIVMNTGIWKQIQDLAQDSDSLFAVTKAAEILPNIKADLDADGLLAFAKEAKAAGLLGAQTFDAYYEDWYDEFGNTWKWVPAEPLCIMLGTNVAHEGAVPEVGGMPIEVAPAEAEVAPVEGTGVAAEGAAGGEQVATE